MRKDSKFKTFATIAVIAIACISAMIHAWNSAQRAEKDSAMRALAVEIITSLESYHKIKGSYPDSLRVLCITNFPDGSTQKMIEQFHYKSDGNTLALDWNELHIKR